MARLIAWLCAWSLLALFVACSDSPETPGNPSGAGASSAAAGGSSSNGGSDAQGSGASGAQGSGGGSPGAGGNGGGAPGVEPVLVAFIGDSGKGNNFKSVLDLVIAEQADAVIHNGDFDYGLDPDAFFSVVDTALGADYPYFASVGNHDAPSWTDYSAYLVDHMDKVGVTPDDPDLSDQKFAFLYQGLRFVFVGENGENAEFAEFIADQLDPAADEWKICGWHKNQNAMQIGGKGNEMGWDVYENCRLAGAIITTGHEHSYERTKTLVSMEQQTVDETCSGVAETCVSPGRTMAIVSGLGGVGIRDQERCAPATPPYGCKGEWASIYASDQGATYGALFIEFNTGGNPKKAHGYFKNVDGVVIDDFIITRE
ncbi:MAG: metallophosphoesterase [Polyangiaceae bacterium]